MHIPPNVTIPTPMPTVRARGVHALGYLSETRSVKLSRNDFALLKEASALLDMPHAEFIRWCTVEVAKQILWSKK